MTKKFETKEYIKEHIEQFVKILSRIEAICKVHKEGLLDDKDFILGVNEAMSLIHMLCEPVKVEDYTTAGKGDKVH